MATPVHITLIGAGSATFAAGIVRDLCMMPGLEGSHVTLMDVDEGRLTDTLQLAEILCREIGRTLHFTTTTNRRAALEGADFVLNTAQVGGHRWTELQRGLAERHGYYRGARLHDFGQAAFFLDVARDVMDICPDAWIIQSANPVFEGCTLMVRETGANVLGLCHGHYGYRRIVGALGLDPGEVSARMPGFNHWIWMTDFRYRGRDAYPLIDEWIDTCAEEYWQTNTPTFADNQLSRAAVHQYKLFGLMPIGDAPRIVGWWYHTSLAEKQRWFGELGGFDSEIGWGQYLAELESKVEQVHQVAAGSGRATDVFGPELSDEQIVPIIDSLVNDNEGLYQVNIPNEGELIKGFPEDLVVEVQGVVDGSGIRGISEPAFPPRIMAGAMIPRWQRAEMLVHALSDGDRELLYLYILEDHRTGSFDAAVALIDDWLREPDNKRLSQIFRPS